MEEKIQSSQYLEKSKHYNSPAINRVKNYTKLNEDNEDRLKSDKNLRNKLDNAFTDLDSLRKALKDIKYKNENNFPQNSNTFANQENYNFNSSVDKNVNFTPRRNNFGTLNNNNNSIDKDDVNGGSRSRSNSNNKSANYTYYNNRTERNNYLKTPKASSKSKIYFFYFFLSVNF